MFYGRGERSSEIITFADVDMQDKYLELAYHNFAATVPRQEKGGNFADNEDKYFAY
jgi:hypothetical protein